ncbi:MAG: polyphosphate polymerase domain-containing protein [Chitinivibrionales bacterium]|nr:polyphosphate polymerase domain-containing protein [Chitinivibrionales bacterium]
MMNKKKQVTPPVLERYELKFLIPFELVDPISEFVSIYCSMDEYSANSEDLYYQITSLYLDTPQETFYYNRIYNIINRFNMRIRAYGETPQPPYFFEVKHKANNFIRKYRASVKADSLIDCVNDDDERKNFKLKDSEKKNYNLFQRLRLQYNAEPRIIVQYRRKAFASNCDDYARVTFDKGLRFYQQLEYDCCCDPKSMHYYCPYQNIDPTGTVILELKSYVTSVPLWMIDLIKTFRLEKAAFSKYANGVREILGYTTPSNDYRITSTDTDY